MKVQMSVYVSKEALDNVKRMAELTGKSISQLFTEHITHSNEGAIVTEKQKIFAQIRRRLKLKQKGNSYRPYLR